MNKDELVTLQWWCEHLKRGIILVLVGLVITIGINIVILLRVGGWL